MPDDFTPSNGHIFFGPTDDCNIANENAVRRTFEVLQNETAFNAAFADLLDGPAYNAVRNAAERKNNREHDEPRDLETYEPDTSDLGVFIEGTDFWL